MGGIPSVGADWSPVNSSVTEQACVELRSSGNDDVGSDDVILLGGPIASFRESDALPRTPPPSPAKPGVAAYLSPDNVCKAEHNFACLLATSLKGLIIREYTEEQTTKDSHQKLPLQTLPMNAVGSRDEISSTPASPRILSPLSLDESPEPEPDSP